MILANKSSVESTQCGELILPFDNANGRLERGFCIPSLCYIFVSAGNLADRGTKSHSSCTNVKLILKENDSSSEVGIEILPLKCTV